MNWQGGRLGVGAAIASALVAIAAMYWFWRNGGVQLALPQSRDTAVEECNATLSGSSTVGLKLAPSLVSDFLRDGGYEVGEPTIEPEGVTRIVGRRERFRCTIVVRALESTTGFRDLASGEALVALSSRPILPADIEALKRSGSGDFEAERALAEHVIAYDALAVVVSASNPARQITLDQVRTVVLGPTRNWIDLGGAREGINVYAPLEQAGPDDFPNDLVQSADLTWVNAQERPHIHVERDDPSVLARVGEDRVGLGFVSASFERNPARVRALLVSAGGRSAAPSAANVRAQAYPIARRLFIYVRPADMRANPFVQRFTAYAKSSAAFERIEQLGFVALHPNATVDANAVRDIGCRIGAPESAALASALKGARRLAEILRYRENTSELDDAARADIDRLAPQLADQIARGDEVVLVGHSDLAGRAERNRTLALDRALSARAAFEARGAYGLGVESAGEMCPIADIETAAGRRANRRVEIWVRPRDG